jgi:hypothetical protein
MTPPTEFGAYLSIGISPHRQALRVNLGGTAAKPTSGWQTADE